jgi:O-succinylhomoserine sulfhydrylase
VLLKGLETLELRVRRQTATAAALADLLADHPRVKDCRYPLRADHPQHAVAACQMSGGGTLVAFDLGTKDAAFRLANALKTIDISNNLGDAKSLLTHPETTTHSKVAPAERLAMGVTPGLMRISVGLEDADDLCEDLDQALKVA